MRKINNYSDLKEERRRLLEKQACLESALKADLNEFREEMDPCHLIAKAAGKLVMGKEDNFMGFTAGALTRFIFKKIILRKSGFLTKFIGSYAAGNLTSKVFSNNKENIFNWVTSLFQNLSKNEEQVPEKLFTNIGYQ